MAHDQSVSDNRLPGRWSTVTAVAVLAVVGLALAAAAVMWFRYGTTVFFQTLAAGIAACF